MNIQWLGSTDCFKQPLRTFDKPDVYCAMTEEAVWRTALANEKAGLPGIRPKHALRVTNRLSLRVALAPTGLNPRWRPCHLGPGWVKQTSVCNRGVTELQETSVLQDIERTCPEIAEFGVWEERVGGKAVEVDGYVACGKTQILASFQQLWLGNRIKEYVPISSTGGGYAMQVEKVIEALGLNHLVTPFCFEFRGGCLIDAHTRWPEDYRLREHLPDPIGDMEFDLSCAELIAIGEKTCTAS